MICDPSGVKEPINESGHSCEWKRRMIRLEARPYSHDFILVLWYFGKPWDEEKFF
jgi:hypothetical protein